MDTLNQKNRIPLFQRMAEFFFIIYLITLYVFVDRDETLIYSNIAFILFAGFSLLRIMQRKRIYIGKNMMAAYLAFTWMQATTFWATNTYLAGDRMKTMWLLFLLLFITYNLFYEKEDAHAYLLKGLYIAGIALVIYSLKIYGISGAIEMMSGENGVRLGTEINQANSFGMMNSITIIIGFYYLLHKRAYKIFHMAVISGAFLYAMSSGSRKALLMMCIGVLLLIYRKYGIKKLYKLVAVLTVIVILFMAVIQLPAFDLIRGRMEGTFDSIAGIGQDDSSAQKRRRMIETGWELFKDRMLTGYGANNFAYISGFWTYSHNNFIEILVDFGLIGFILYYMIYIMGIKTLWKSDSREGKTLLIIILVKLMMEMALVTYYSKQQWLMLAFAMVACREQLPTSDNKEEETPTPENNCKEVETYEFKNIKEESEECGFEPETDIIIPFEQAEDSMPVFGQDISQDEVLGYDGQETQS